MRKFNEDGIIGITIALLFLLFGFSVLMWGILFVIGIIFVFASIYFFVRGGYNTKNPIALALLAIGAIMMVASFIGFDAMQFANPILEMI